MRTKSRRLGTAMVSAVAVAAIAAGCGASEDSGGSTGTATSGGGAASAEDLTVGVSNLGLSFPFPSAISKGIHERADELGVAITELDAKGDPNKQSDDMQDLVAQEPDGILLLPVDSGVAQGLVNQAAEAEIPTVAVASQVGDPNERDLKDVYPRLAALVTQDEIAAGAKAAELVEQVLPDGGKIAVVEGQAGFAEVKLRQEGFDQVLQESGASYETIASQPGDWLPDKAEAACQNMIASHPDIDVFYAQSDDMAVGCAKAVRKAGSDADVVGIGGSKLAIQAIKKGQLAGTVCYKPEDMGRLALQTLVDHLTGAEPVDHAFVSYETPAITKDNVDDCVPQW